MLNTCQRTFWSLVRMLLFPAPLLFHKRVICNGALEIASRQSLKDQVRSIIESKYVPKFLKWTIWSIKSNKIAAHSAFLCPPLLLSPLLLGQMILLCSAPYLVEIKVLILSLKMMSLFFFCLGTEKVHYESALWLMASNRYGWRGKNTFRQCYKTQKRQADSSAGNEKGGRCKQEWMLCVCACVGPFSYLIYSYCFYFLDGFHLELMPCIRDLWRVHLSNAKHLQLPYSTQIRTKAFMGDSFFFIRL